MRMWGKLKIAGAVSIALVSSLLLSSCQPLSDEEQVSSPRIASEKPTPTTTTPAPRDSAQPGEKGTETTVVLESPTDTPVLGIIALSVDPNQSVNQVVSNVTSTLSAQEEAKISLNEIESIGFGYFSIPFVSAQSTLTAQSLREKLMSSGSFSQLEDDKELILQEATSIDETGATAVQTMAVGGSLWGLDRIDQRALPLNGSYEYDTYGSGVVAYVMDTGINLSHTEFAGRIAAGFDGISDGNGTNDCSGHGTHVAGTLGGTNYGVAKSATLVPVRVLNCSGQEGSSSLLIRGLSWVATHHPAGQPAVLNMSLVMYASDAIDNAVRQVIADGVVVVAASGNSGTINGAGNSCLWSPARVPEVITVNASTIADDDASFSNYGSCSDLYAPGQSIFSASIGSSSATRTLSGTSMATPHVAGVVARLLSVNPSMTPAQIHSLIVSTASVVDFGLSQLGDPNRLLYADAVASNANYVRNLYRDFFGRVASESEVGYWSGELNAGRMTRDRLTKILATSDEWISSVVRSFYLDTLGREPDAAGYAYWISQARAGKPIADVGSFFYGSDEYFIVTGQSNYRVWIEDLYQKLMLRQGDAGGIDYWVQQLNSGMSRPAVSHWFYQSPEKLGLRVDSLYTKLLNRGSDPGGRSYWASRLYVEGDLSLASMLAQSDEYFLRRFQ